MRFDGTLTSWNDERGFGRIESTQGGEPIWKLPLWVGGFYFVLSVATFVVYAADKSAATSRSWRTPESTLHALALAGGWPGALLAQQFLRHKSTKPEFRQVFWATVLVNVGGLVLLASKFRHAMLNLL